MIGPDDDDEVVFDQIFAILNDDELDEDEFFDDDGDGDA